MMGELAISFQSDLTNEEIKVYFKRLNEFSIYQVEKAIDKIIDTEDRFPTVKVFRDYARAFKRDPPQPAQDVPQIEERVLPNDLPRNKEDFFDAMHKLYGDVDINQKGS